MNEIRKPKPGDKLISDQGLKLLDIDWPSGNWFVYAMAYKDAADRLVEQIQDYYDHDDKPALPILFLYRHWVELRLKTIIIRLDILCRTQMPKEDFGKHNLENLWRYVNDHLSCLPDAGDTDQTEIGSLESLIKELSNLDHKSMNFRYPHSLTNSVFALPGIMSMSHLKAMMNVLDNGLSYVEGGLDAQEEANNIEADMEAEYRRYMD